jgi:hypothetical protein
MTETELPMNMAWINLWDTERKTVQNNEWSSLGNQNKRGVIHFRYCVL